MGGRQDGDWQPGLDAAWATAEGDDRETFQPDRGVVCSSSYVLLRTYVHTCLPTMYILMYVRCMYRMYVIRGEERAGSQE